MNLRVGDLLPRLNYRVVHPETHTVFHPRISFTHTLVHITQKNGASDTMALLAAGRKGHFGPFILALTAALQTGEKNGRSLTAELLYKPVTKSSYERV